MTPTAADIVSAARMEVYLKHPYLSCALFALRPVPAPGLGTMAVDEGWRMYYDPKTVVEWFNESQRGSKRNGDQAHHGVAAVVYHEVGHCLREHFKRTGDREPGRANRAQDREINDDVIEAGWILPGKPLLPKQIGMADGLTFEEYYQKEPVSPTMKIILVPGSGCSCGGITGNPTEWEKANTSAEGGGATQKASPTLAPGAGSDSPAPPLPTAADDHEQQIVLRRTALDIDKHVKAHGKGSVPAGLQAWAKTKLTPPVIDWRKRLAGLTRQALMATAGAVDFTWQKTGRRSLYAAGRTGWPIAPALHQPIPKVAVVLDTSGSMLCSLDGERSVLDAALSEVVGIALAAGGAVTVYACDAAVQAKARISKVADLEKLNKGGGGTNLAPGWLEAKKDRPDVCCIITDGLVGDDWPTALDCRGVRPLAVLVGAGVHPPAHIPFVEAK
jgi:predicted metal-dependent peptidase